MKRAASSTHQSFQIIAKMNSVEMGIRRKSIPRRAALRMSLPSQTYNNNESAGPSAAETSAQLYNELMELENKEGVIRNKEFVFCVRCDFCVDEYAAISLRNCLHNVCLECTRDCIFKSSTTGVQCPAPSCEYNLQDKEVRALLTPIEFAEHMNKRFENWLHGNLYSELKVAEEDMGFLNSTDRFECEICMMDIDAGDGMMIRDCLHQFCIDCVRATIVSSADAQIPCPQTGCESFISDREIRHLLTQEEFDKYMERTLRIAEATMANSYHCKKPNCNGWCVVEDAVNVFQCPSCTSINCLQCQAIHQGLNCKEYQDELRFKGLDSDQRSEVVMEELIKEGQGMKCPKCKVMIMKRTGCDFMICSMCKTPICWATRGPRWGPGGVGDTSGGCKCRVVPFQKCHPSCQNCH